ncbi:hypothetical protein E4U61_004172 [Claviceps capensis]|nr:hypothetical protein E4U61_004172 [Claviceps capensis]
MSVKITGGEAVMVRTSAKSVMIKCRTSSTNVDFVGLWLADGVVSIVCSGGLGHGPSYVDVVWQRLDVDAPMRQDVVFSLIATTLDIKIDDESPALVIELQPHELRYIAKGGAIEQRSRAGD